MEFFNFVGISLNLFHELYFLPILFIKDFHHFSMLLYFFVYIFFEYTHEFFHHVYPFCLYLTDYYELIFFQLPGIVSLLLLLSLQKFQVYDFQLHHFCLLDWSEWTRNFRLHFGIFLCFFKSAKCLVLVASCTGSLPSSWPHWGLLIAASLWLHFSIRIK